MERSSCLLTFHLMQFSRGCSARVGPVEVLHRRSFPALLSALPVKGWRLGGLGWGDRKVRSEQLTLLAPLKGR